MALNPAPVGCRTLRDKAAQRLLALAVFRAIADGLCASWFSDTRRCLLIRSV